MAMNAPMKTYSIDEVAALICGDSMKNPALWVRRKIRDGTFSGFKAGRSVRMTHKQLEDALAALEIGCREPPRRHGITAASMRRRRTGERT
jgi:hypothetical protein